MKARLKRLGTTASAWPGQASVNFKTTQCSQDRRVADVWRCTHLVGYYMNYHTTAKRFTASLPKNLALAILVEIGEAERIMWHGHPADHGGVGARLVWHENQGRGSQHTITATTSHQAP